MARFNLHLARSLAIGLALSVLCIQPAEARRGGSFGSRGSRTYFAPAQTASSPKYVSPIQRSMTARPLTARSPAFAPQPPPPTGSRFGGLGGGLIGGLLAGGLIGSLMGHGMGGFGGMGMGGGGGLLLSLIQLALLGGIAWFVVGLFRRNSALGQAPPEDRRSLFGAGYSAPAASQPYMSASPPMQNIPVTKADQAEFERLLIEIQDAFGHEDYGRLRERTTPEIMSYLAEELSQNATRGLRNDVTETELIQGDVAEAWSEGSADYATVAMRYQSIDVTRDRNTKAVVEGDPSRATEITELWTFVREGNAPWKLSAIQES